MASSSSDAVFETVTDGAALLRWADKIRGDSPRSASIHNALLIHGKGYMDMYLFYVLKEKPETNVVMLKDKTDQFIIGLYCPEAHEDVLLEALSRTEVISWEEMLCFFYVPETLAERLRQLVQGKIGDGKLDSSTAELCSYHPEKDSEKLECPSGFSVKRLSPEAVLQMFSVWKYRECMKSSQFLDLCKKAPCAGVYRTSDGGAEQVLDIATSGLPDAGDDEKAVAWATSTMYGPLGMLGVTQSLKKYDDPKDKQLRKRVEQLVISACARAMLRAGFLAHAYQEKDDETEIKDIPGWTRVSSSTWLWRCDKMPQIGQQEDGEANN